MLRVLLIAESAERSQQLQKRLQEIGDGVHTVSPAASPSDAKELLSTRSFDLALLDLPDATTSAMAFLEIFRWRNRPLAVLAIDQYFTDSRRDRFEQEGITTVVADDSDRTAAELETQLRAASANTRMARRLMSRMLVDPLTGLPGRPIFHDRLEQAITEANRRNELLALHRVDLDHFADVNRAIEIETGDEILTKLARRLDQQSRETDTVARLSGDSFAVIQGNLRTSDYAKVLAKKLQRAISTQIQIGAHAVEISASIGIAMFPADAVDSEDLLNCSDAALNVSKQKGGGTFTFFETLARSSTNES